MSEYQFISNFKGTADSLFSRAVKEAQRYNAKFEGNSNKGNFEVKFIGSLIKGSYFTSNDIITIRIDKKPFLISHKLIETVVKNFINT